MLIYYWSPYLTNIATINAVTNSIVALEKFSKKDLRYKINIINACGEWSNLKNIKKDIETINLLPFNLHKFLPKEGFIQSRISMIIIAIVSFLPLLVKIRKNKPDYIIIHLLTSLPLFLSFFFPKNTKVILRISGLPNLNLFRRLFCKTISNKIYRITTPTKLTRDDLVSMKIFDKEKIQTLYDPVINCKKLNILKKKSINNNFINDKYYLAIGRLTGQKNFSFLIESFSEIILKLKIKKLLIVGSGEEEFKLKKIISSRKMDNNIFLLGHKSNPYKYIYNCEALISTALYEDPGFAILETAFLNKSIISSLCRNGPKEFYTNYQAGHFYEVNNKNDFLQKILNFENDENNYKKKLNAKIMVKKYTMFTHYKTLSKILI
jgi:glycosyltransferase involved in cell wall biosynthesis